MFTRIFMYFLIITNLRANEEEETIDLKHLGPKLFGKPIENKNNGSVINLNFEEVGPYLEGDLLVPVSTRNGMKTESLRWKKAELPYIIRGRYSSSEMNVIQNAFNQFHKSTCIKFVPRRSQTDYVVIENAQTGCWSSVGRLGGEQKINLQSPGCVTKSGTVVHEMLHALGFLHEQNREERDKFVSILDKNIRTGYEVNFRKAAPGETTGFGVGYDYGSVLHYSKNAFSKNGQPTIEAKSSTSDKMGQREGFSKKDIEKVNKMYKCKQTTAEQDPGIMSSTIKPASGGGFSSIWGALFPSSSMDEEEMVVED